MDSSSGAFPFPIHKIHMATVTYFGTGSTTRFPTPQEPVHEDRTDNGAPRLCESDGALICTALDTYDVIEGKA